jgi:hypothetical protein
MSFGRCSACDCDPCDCGFGSYEGGRTITFSEPVIEALFWFVFSESDTLCEVLHRAQKLTYSDAPIQLDLRFSEFERVKEATKEALYDEALEDEQIDSLKTFSAQW